MRRSIAWVLGLSLLACSASDDTGTEAADEPEITEDTVRYLTPEEHLVRIAMALTGERPTPEQLRAVRDDADALPGIVDEYLESDGFGEMVRDLYNEALQVRVGAAVYPAGFPPVDVLAGLSLQEVNTSIVEAPLRLVEHVVRNDRPLSEIVTAEYAVADATVASVWGMTHDGSDGWVESTYEDGRPMAGLLSDSWLFTRHSTTFSNQNRGRANTVSRALLCTDYVERQLEVDTSINLADPAEVANAVSENSACASCHQTLDPLAGYLASYTPLFLPGRVSTYPVTFYQPSLSRVFSVRDPAYFGFSGGDVRYLGQLIAEDPRFSLCAARRFYAYLHQVPLAEVPLSRAGELQGAFVASELDAKNLAKSIVLSDDFRVAEPLVEDPDGEFPGLLKARAWQFARLFEDRTGIRWEAELDFELEQGRIGTVDMMRDSLFGYEVLAGGIDAQNVSQPAHTMTATTSLVLSGLAAQGADAVVDADLAAPGQAKVLVGVDTQRTDEDSVRKVLAGAFLRLYGEFVEPDSEAVDLSYALFRDALGASGDPVRAWKTTAYAMLQDIRMVYY